jgi:hypothetical protein
MIVAIYGGGGGGECRDNDVDDVKRTERRMTYSIPRVKTTATTKRVGSMSTMIVFAKIRNKINDGQEQW